MPAAHNNITAGNQLSLKMPAAHNKGKLGSSLKGKYKGFNSTKYLRALQ